MWWPTGTGRAPPGAASAPLLALAPAEDDDPGISPLEEQDMARHKPVELKLIKKFVLINYGLGMCVMNAAFVCCSPFVNTVEMWGESNSTRKKLHLVKFHLFYIHSML